MNFIKKIIILVFVFHFSMTGAYLASSFNETSKIRKFTAIYMEPVFRQRWDLFAPNPLSYSSRFLVKCFEHESWSDPLLGLIEQNNRFPLIHRQTLLSLYDSLSKAILKQRRLFVDENHCLSSTERECQNLFESYIQNSQAYGTLLQIAQTFCQKTEMLPHLAIYVEHAYSTQRSSAPLQSKTELLRLNNHGKAF
jgi:hypothetical protein